MFLNQTFNTAVVPIALRTTFVLADCRFSDKQVLNLGPRDIRIDLARAFSHKFYHWHIFFQKNEHSFSCFKT